MRTRLSKRSTMSLTVTGPPSSAFKRMSSTVIPAPCFRVAPSLGPFAILATCILGLPTLAAEMPFTPFAGQQARQVRALSDEDIAALRPARNGWLARHGALLHRAASAAPPTARR